MREFRRGVSARRAAESPLQSGGSRYKVRACRGDSYASGKAQRGGGGPCFEAEFRCRAAIKRADKSKACASANRDEREREKPALSVQCNRVARASCTNSNVVRALSHERCLSPPSPHCNYARRRKRFRAYAIVKSGEFSPRSAVVAADPPPPTRFGGGHRFNSR